MSKEVTVILTSSGRFDLLRITIESFLLHNTYPIKEFFVHDDSGGLIPQEFRNDFHFIEWTCCVPTKNQIASLDYLWSKVKTEYCAQLEDDWEFTREGFIEASMEIMEANPKILMVWLKELEAKNVHPVEWHAGGYFGKEELKHFNGQPFGIFKTSPNLWAWHRFNPSLKRKADYDLIAPFSKHTTFDPHKGWKSEAAISKVYNSMGFTAAILPEVYIKHLGEGRRVV